MIPPNARAGTRTRTGLPPGDFKALDLPWNPFSPEGRGPQRLVVTRRITWFVVQAVVQTFALGAAATRGVLEGVSS